MLRSLCPGQHESKALHMTTLPVFCSVHNYSSGLTVWYCCCVHEGIQLEVSIAGRRGEEKKLVDRPCRRILHIPGGGCIEWIEAEVEILITSYNTFGYRRRWELILDSSVLRLQVARCVYDSPNRIIWIGRGRSGTAKCEKLSVCVPSRTL